MRFLVIGANGQLGKELLALSAKRNYETVPVDLPEINICDPVSIEGILKDRQPDIIINTAAYTAVDKAEEESEVAYKVNHTGAANLAAAARKFNCRLVHVSTDYVFGNGFSSPIKEDAPTDPLNVYGASKLAGEKSILETYPENSLIVRTASLHGQYGANFVHTMIRLFKEKEKVSVVSDQIMSPTWAGWLAKALFEVALKDCCGVVHASCGQAVSWFDFAKAIYEETASHIENKPEIVPIAAADYPRAARRASYSVLDVSRLRSLTAPDFIIGWREGLRGHLAGLSW